MPPAPVEIGVLYAQHASLVRNVVRRFLKDPADVDDAVHDVFLQACRQFERYSADRGTVEAWLSNIARSRALDRLRYRAVRSGTEALAEPDAIAGDAVGPADRAAMAEAAGRMRREWGALPAAYRDVLHLAYTENLSQRAIAERLGCTLGIVKSRMQQGLRALRLAIGTRPSAGLEFAEEPCEWALTVLEEDVRRPLRSRNRPALTDLQVLIVDDDDQTRTALMAVLGRAGACPLPCASVEEARTTLQTVWPDILLADLSMPGEDGYALIAHVRRMEAITDFALPAIAFTARASEAERTRALLAGFQRHLSKPVHPSALLTAIEQVIATPAIPEIRYASLA